MARSIQHPEVRLDRETSDVNPLTSKLLHFAPLSLADRQVLDDLGAPEELFPADVDIITEGMVPRSVSCSSRAWPCGTATCPMVGDRS